MSPTSSSARGRRGYLGKVSLTLVALGLRIPLHSSAPTEDIRGVHLVVFDFRTYLNMIPCISVVESIFVFGLHGTLFFIWSWSFRFLFRDIQSGRGVREAFSSVLAISCGVFFVTVCEIVNFLHPVYVVCSRIALISTELGSFGGKLMCSYYSAQRCSFYLFFYSTFFFAMSVRGSAPVLHPTRSDN